MSEHFIETYRQWLTGEVFDEATRAELRGIEGDAREIEERFYKELNFGTAGLRGILGAGTNRMNIYTVGKVTQGLCDSLLDNPKKAGSMVKADNPEKADSPAAPGIVISFDPRHMSAEFARECARIIAANGIHAYLFDDIRPTPELSFAVRRLGCAAGIMITASHNPSAYNGYKVYGADGAQMSVADSDRVVDYTARLSGYEAIKKISVEEAHRRGLLTVIGKAVDDAYIEQVHSLSLRLGELGDTLKTFKVIYTPLHGTGNRLVRRVLAENGFSNVLVVPEQELPDPEFSTVKSPNPENREAFELAIALARRENVDIIIGSDPDCDRIGVVFRDFDGGYAVLTGNQIGCLLMEYVLAARRDAGRLDKDRAFVVKTIVTTKLANQIAAHYGLAICEVFTGFKYICEVVKERDEFGDGQFAFGFEESNGYLAGTFVRDKDGVIASMLVAEMAAWYRSQGRTLADAMKDIYDRYGYTIDDVVSYTLEGKQGLDRIAAAMERLRAERPDAFGAFRVKLCKDYQTDESFESGAKVPGGLGMGERSNVLSYQMEDGSVFLIRPSGTEPKIKVYYGVTDASREGAQELLRDFEGAVSAVIRDYLGI
ncbi:MAG: phospho-sugar mutase [Clostridiales bacterium]|jgi:phosphoglucomutase|nr:phospho-sugar mutase [Clostridiales bacterium]